MAEISKVRTFGEILDEGLEYAKIPPRRAPTIVVAFMALFTSFYSVITAGVTMGGGILAGISLAALFVMIPALLAVQLGGYSLLAILATERVFGRELTVREACGRLFTVNMLATLFLATILLGLSLMMFLLPFLVVSALFSFLFPVMIVEGLYLGEAIQRTSSLAWRNPRGRLRSAPLVQIMAAHTGFFALSWGLTLALQLPIQIFTQYAVFRETLTGEMPDPSSLTAVLVLQVPANIVGTFASGFAAYFLCHVLALLFREAREVREARSIDEALQSWQVAGETLAPEAAVP